MTILQALDSYYDRMAARGEATSLGWSSEPIGIVVVLAPDGSVIDIDLRLDEKGKKARSLPVPKPFNRQGIGSTPYLFWDNTAYALGLSEKDPVKTARDHAASRKLHLEMLADCADPELAALRRFFERWTPRMFQLPFEPRMLAWNLAFRLDGVRGRIHEGQGARPIIEDFLSKYESGGVAAQPNQCLVTGRITPPRTLHTKIKGIPGTSNPEVPLVSFNQDAFESYGKKQAENAPVSSAAVSRYAAALTALLDRGSVNRLRRGIGDATVVFWADTSEMVDERAAAAAEEFLSLFLEPEELAGAQDEDRGEAAKLGDKLAAVAEGRPLANLDPGLVAGTRLHVLGLAPNAARLSVRFWLTDSLDAFARRLAAHYVDLEIAPKPVGWGVAPAVGRLLVRTTALQEKFENIPPQLAGELARAVLGGTAYPRSWLAATVIRLRAGDSPGRGWHAAAIKACLNRPFRIALEGLEAEGADPDRIASKKKEMLPVALDPEFPDAAYQLGRLFSVLEAAQRAALGQVNATIADRYYGAASATPARVFGPLLRGLRVHVSDARRRGFGGWIEPRVAEIMSHLPPELPRTLKLEEQGRFAVGYYHERGSRPKAKDEEAALAVAAEGDKS